jgi:hypothetical protein
MALCDFIGRLSTNRVLGPATSIRIVDIHRTGGSVLVVTNLLTYIICTYICLEFQVANLSPGAQ